ncbi:MAG: hypothetical protein ACLS9K_14070 [Lachnospira eligens]
MALEHKYELEFVATPFMKKVFDKPSNQKRVVIIFVSVESFSEDFTVMGIPI